MSDGRDKIVHINLRESEQGNIANSSLNNDVFLEPVVINFLQRLYGYAVALSDYQQRTKVELNDVIYSINFDARSHIGGIYYDFGDDDSADSDYSTESGTTHQYSEDDDYQESELSDAEQDLAISTEDIMPGESDLNELCPDSSYDEQVAKTTNFVSFSFFNAYKVLMPLRRVSINAAQCLEEYARDQFDLFRKLNSNSAIWRCSSSLTTPQIMDIILRNRSSELMTATISPVLSSSSSWSPPNGWDSSTSAATSFTSSGSESTKISRLVAKSSITAPPNTPECLVLHPKGDQLSLPSNSQDTAVKKVVNGTDDDADEATTKIRERDLDTLIQTQHKVLSDLHSHVSHMMTILTVALQQVPPKHCADTDHIGSSSSSFTEPAKRAEQFITPSVRFSGDKNWEPDSAELHEQWRKSKRKMVNPGPVPDQIEHKPKHNRYSLLHD